MHYLTTGCAGFIGSHLTNLLLQQGHKVTGIDNLCTGDIENIRPHLNNPNFTFLQQDIREHIFIKCDYVFNLACPASPAHYMRLPLETLDAGYNGIINILEYCNKLNIPILQTSTSEIYGDPLEHPQKETYFGNVNTMGKRSCYDESKRIAETLCYEYSLRNTKVHLARLFNTYGPNMCVHDGRVISEFLVNAINNEPLIINGDGNTTRSFSYIDDTLNGILKLSNSGYFNEPFNIGNPEEITLNELASRVIEITGSKSKIVYDEFLQNDPKKRKPDITKIKNALNWEPVIPLEKGLSLTYDYFRKKLANSGN